MSTQDFKDKTKYVLSVTSFLVIAISTFVLAPEVFLLVFAGLLVSVFLISLRDLLTKYLKLPKGPSLAIVVLLLTLLIVVTGVTVAPSIAEQFDQLVKEVPKVVTSFQSKIEHYSWGNFLLEKFDSEKIMDGNVSAVKGVGGALTGLFGFFGNAIIILFIGLYGAADPKLYKNGFLKLIPKKQKDRADEVMSEIFETLKWWLVGQFFSMAVIGVSTTIGLWLLDIPLAFILGIIAAMLTFIPNIGPVIAAIPAILLSLTIDPKIALYVALLYFGTQAVESYLLTPLVQQKTIDLPPVLILATQVLFGLTLGLLGVSLAAPLTAAAIVLTKMLYVEDYLGKDPA